VSAEPIAVVASYDDLVAALRGRLNETGMTYETAENLSGLQPGYISKVLGPRHVRTLGHVSLTLLLGVLGVKLAVIEDAEQTERMKPRWEPRLRRRQDSEKPIHREFCHAVRHVGGVAPQPPASEPASVSTTQAA
jgi:hypothetical protein